MVSAVKAEEESLSGKQQKSIIATLLSAITRVGSEQRS